MKIKKVRPLLNHIITTANVYETDQVDGGVLGDDGRLEGQFKEYQTVVAVGPNVATVKPGDVVCINPKAYAVPRHKQREDSIAGLMGGDEIEMIVQFPILPIDGVPHLFIYDRDVDFIIDEMEEEGEIAEEPSTIIE